MKRLFGVLAAACLAAGALSLSACATTPADPLYGTPAASADLGLTVEHGLAAARGSHALICKAVIAAHAGGVLKGRNFNQAKKACVDADDDLDAAEAAWILGQTLVAQQKIAGANAQLDRAKALTPAQ